ncbi:hypothetical protein D3C85_1018780 [compost metagenome]
MGSVVPNILFNFITDTDFAGVGIQLGIDLFVFKVFGVIELVWVFWGVVFI